MPRYNFFANMNNYYATFTRRDINGETVYSQKFSNQKKEIMYKIIAYNVDRILKKSMQKMLKNWKILSSRLENAIFKSKIKYRRGFEVPYRAEAD